MFTREIYDKDAYIHDLKEWTRPGQYYLMPQSTYRDYTCFQPIVEMHPNNRQFNVTHQNDMMDIESDLYNLNRPNTKNPYKKYPHIPLNPNLSAKQIPVCAGANDSFNFIYPKLEGSQYNREKQISVARFESLCLNPQQFNRIRSNNVIGLDTRLYFRDTSKEKVPNPVDQTNQWSNTANLGYTNYNSRKTQIPPKYTEKNNPITKCATCK